MNFTELGHEPKHVAALQSVSKRSCNAECDACGQLVHVEEQQQGARRAERFHRTVQAPHEVADRAEAFGAGVGALLGGAAAATSGAVRGVAEGLQATLGGLSSGVA
eukprot:1797802-Amphidinium_carterae.4